MGRWRKAIMDNGMRVMFSENEFGASIVYRGFWLHLPELDWQKVQDFFEAEFAHKPEKKPDVVVFTELDGGAMIGYPTVVV